MSSVDGPVAVRVIAKDPPFGSERGVLFGLQDKGGVVEPAPAMETTVFETIIELVRSAERDVDFRGRHVHGKPGDRFLYLSWGVSDGDEPFVMFARAKIKLADAPPDLLAEAAGGGAAIECRVAATNDKGQPATGSIRPPAVTWSAEPSS